VRSAQEHIAGMAAVYASCASYRDRGCVVTQFFDLAGKLTKTTERFFATAFRRPNQFRFESRQRLPGRVDWRSDVVWKSGEVVRTSRDVEPRDLDVELEAEGEPEQTSLARGLAATTGTSGGAAHTIPALLLPREIGGRKLTDLVGVKLLGRAAVDGVSCHRLVARHGVRDPAAQARLDEEVSRLTGRPRTKARRGPTHLWIAVDTLLLRRRETRVVFDAFSTTSVTDWHGEVDVALADEALAFEDTPPPPSFDPRNAMTPG
jgi:hypothetical protein